MSKIVIDARELRTTTGRYIERLIHYLQQTKSEHEFIVLLQPKDMSGWEPTSPNFTKLECPHKEFTLSEQISFLKQLRGIKADLVHFGMTQQPVLYRGKAITTIHDLTTLRFTNPSKNLVVFKFKQFVYKHVTKTALKKSVGVITPTKFVKDDLLSFCPVNPDKITVTYEGADYIESPSTPLSYLQNKKFIAYLGRPTPHKNLERLIEAFTLLRGQHPDLVLALAGKKDANYERIELMVKQNNIKNVVFTDYLTDGELKWLYENCETYVFPSLSEGFGLPGLEAMAQGAPVTSSNATCLPEVYGEAAHYFNPEDVQSMSDAINEVLTNKDLRQKLITAGAAQVKKYSWKRMAEQTLETYNRALK